MTMFTITILTAEIWVILTMLFQKIALTRSDTVSLLVINCSHINCQVLDQVPMNHMELVST